MLDTSLDGANYDLFRPDLTGQQPESMIDSKVGDGGPVTFSLPSIPSGDRLDIFRVRRD